MIHKIRIIHKKILVHIIEIFSQRKNILQVIPIKRSIYSIKLSLNIVITQYRFQFFFHQNISRNMLKFSKCIYLRKRIPVTKAKILNVCSTLSAVFLSD